MSRVNNWGEPFWKTVFECPVSAFEHDVHAAVIGAGLTGLSTAYHLRRARPDWRVTVLEAETVGSGASGRSGGIALNHTAAGPEEGFERSIQFVAELIAREGIDCDWRITGCWEVVHEESAGDWPLQWIDEGLPLRVKQLIEGGTVDPGRLVAGMGRAAVSTGAAIHEYCPVNRVDFEASPLKLQTPKGELCAEFVVFATNGFHPRMSGIAGKGMPMLTLALATEPLSAECLRDIGMESGTPFYTADLPYLWGRLTADNRMIAGSGLLQADEKDLEDVSIDSPLGTELFATLERRVHGLAPALSGVEITHRWAGPIVITDDWRPLLRRHPHSPQVLFAGGYSGHGITQTLRMGALVADHLA